MIVIAAMVTLSAGMGAVSAQSGTPISSVPFTISSSGAYYLTKDLALSSTTSNGVTVQADDVTLDLMGYSLIGPGSGSGTGIYMKDRKNVEIRNGTVRKWGDNGIEAEGSCQGLRLLGIRARANVGPGIAVPGYGHLVRDCSVSDNIGYGLIVGSNCLVDRNTASANAGIGIAAQFGCTITNNTSSANWESGIKAGAGCTVKDNTCYENIWPAFVPPLVGTYSAGIHILGNGARVVNNTVRANNVDGIVVEGAQNVIDGNLATRSSRGIHFRQSGNFYANNRVADCTTAFAGSVPTGAGNGGGNASF